MPRNDGSGPMGRGAMTGRGMGGCMGSRRMRRNAGIAVGAGLGLGLAGRGMARRRQELAQE